MAGRADWIRGKVFAHRGLHGDGRVENSLSAFQAAIDAGLGIECDIQRSRDDWLMVFHDWDLKRLFGREEQTEELTADELRALQYDGTGEGPISLDRLLETVAGQVPLLIEIKSQRGYDVDWTCSFVAKYLEEYRGDCGVMSFDPRAARWFANHAPNIVRGLVVTEEGKNGWRAGWERRASLRHSRAEFLAYDIRDLPSAFAARQRAKGLPVASWTVRSLELAHRAALHADAPIAEGAGLS